MGTKDALQETEGDKQVDIQDKELAAKGHGEQMLFQVGPESVHGWGITNHCWARVPDSGGCHT